MSYDVGCWIGSVPVDADAAEEIWDDLARRSGAPPQALLDFVAAVRAEAPDDLAAFDREPPPPWAMSGTLEPEGWVVEVVMTFDGVERGEAVIRRAAAAHGVTVWDPQTEGCWEAAGAPARASSPATISRLAVWVGPRPESLPDAMTQLARRQRSFDPVWMADAPRLNKAVRALEDADLVRGVDSLDPHLVVLRLRETDAVRLRTLLDEHGAVGVDPDGHRLL